jgi:hypothetical protein
LPAGTTKVGKIASGTPFAEIYVFIALAFEDDSRDLGLDCESLSIVLGNRVHEFAPAIYNLGASQNEQNASRLPSPDYAIPGSNFVAGTIVGRIEAHFRILRRAGDRRKAKAADQVAGSRMWK